MTGLIYKILRPQEWRDATENSAYSGAPVDIADGFVHFSTEAQVADTAVKHFGDSDRIHLLGFRPDVFPAHTLKWEKSRGGDLFPHLYAPLNITLACERLSLSRRIDGTFDFSFLKKDKA
ncbi:DUF952 domain-containing protein [Kordiimonas sp.]|uniref:DUF952 domain-containing protein n=1 Tax=Kordiimonas sp. TaxID=1970157 RepID=UPI003A906544